MSRQCVSSSTLLQIEEDLEAEDREVILFGYRGIISQSNLRELLSEFNERFRHGIIEILWLVKRFDLLKKYLKVTKAEAEQLIAKQTKVISDYSYLLIDINGNLEEEDLQSLVFLLKNQLRNLGNLKKTFLCLVADLEKNNLISPENLDLLEKSFQTIRRVDLKNKILKFKQKGHTGISSNFSKSFVIPPPIQRNQVPSSLPKPVCIHNGHKDSTPVQETMPFIQPVHVRNACAPSKNPQLQAEPSDDRYSVRLNQIGFCLIIDCVGNDSEMLGNLFRGLNFVVDVKNYTRIQDVKNILQDTASMEQLRHYDIFICVLISRGNTDSLFFIDECSSGLSLENVRHYFTGRSCPNLVGKPKLFFIQNYIADDCQVQHDGGSLEADGPSYCAGQERRQSFAITPNEADIFWSHCRVTEQQLQRLSGSPSLYLRTLNDLLSNKQKRKHQDIQEIHTELNRIVYNLQSRCSVLLQHTLTKKLYLHPS